MVDPSTLLWDGDLVLDLIIVYAATFMEKNIPHWLSWTSVAHSISSNYYL